MAFGQQVPSRRTTATDDALAAASPRPVRDWSDGGPPIGVRAAVEVPEAQALARAVAVPRRTGSPRAAETRPAYADVSTARRASARPAPAPLPVLVEVVSDAEVEWATRRGLDMLVDQFDERTGRPRGGADEGVSALCAYALVAAGAAVDDPRVKPTHPFMGAVLDALKARHRDWGTTTYGIALRTCALAAARRPADAAMLRADVAALAGGHLEGGYTYHPTGGKGAGQPGEATPDNSNSQYGLLGVWSGAEEGAEVPGGYWKAVYDFWAACQAPTGEWSYDSSPAVKGRRAFVAKPGLPEVLNPYTLAMVTAGAASVLVAGEHAEAEDGFRVGRPPYPPPLRSALTWLGTRDNAVDPAKFRNCWGYTLFGVERVGLASGLKYFGKNDWFRVLARRVVDRQRADGSWDGNLIETSYALLFLSRGRLPILMNKLRLDDAPGRDVGDAWNNRPHDADFLARYTSRQIERGLNWQVISLGREPEDWLDAPIVYLGSHQRLDLKEAELTKLRRYVEAGGMIFTNADSDSDFKGPAGRGLAALAAGPTPAAGAFDKYVAELAAKLFPQHPYAEVPTEHPLFNSLYRLRPRPIVKGVSNGSRLLLVHSPRDVALAWQRRDVADAKIGLPAHQFGVNLFVYAAGRRQEDLRHRLEPAHAPPRPGPRAAAVVVAPLRYAGNWNPEPGAWDRFARVTAWKTNVGIDVRATDVAKLAPGTAAVAHLTGTAAWAPTPTESARLEAFVRAGGVLLVDDCGGGGTFAKATDLALAGWVPPTAWRAVTPEHPLLTGGEPGMADRLTLRPRRWTVEHRTTAADAATRVARVGNGAVVFCPMDLTSGLLDLRTWGISGYEPASCDGFVRNVVLWAMDGRPDGAGSSTRPAN